MNRTTASLTDLLDGSLVWVGLAGQEGTARGGSGAWIAPGLVLTCAHVVPTVGAEVRVGHAGTFFPGTVVDRVPDSWVPDPRLGKLWPYPDLALVEVGPNDRPDHPCIWLAEQSEATGTSVLAAGHAAVLTPMLAPVRVAGEISGSWGFDTGRLWQFTDNEIAPGMSGGPVMDLSTGAVIGLVTTSRAENSDRGGFLVPLAGLRRLPPQRRVEALRRHDTFHALDRRWTSARARLPRTAVARVVAEAAGPEEEVDLLGMLASWPAERTVEDVQEPGPTRTPLRDEVYAALDFGAGDGTQLSPLLQLTEDLIAHAPDGRARQMLHDWTTAVAGRLNMYPMLMQRRRTPPRSGATADRNTVVVAITPGLRNADRYQLDVWLHSLDGPIVHQYCDDEAVHDLDRVKGIVCEQLREALRTLRGDAAVEFVVPIDLFDEAFDELVPTAPTTNLGRRHPVVLRDLERLQDPTTFTDWRRRWQHLQSDSERDPRWLPCTGVPPADRFAAQLELDPEVAIVASSGPSAHKPVQEALKAALDAGVPVAVWRRQSCPEHGQGVSAAPCSGTRFRQAFSSERAHCRHMSLPDLVRRLRIQSAASDNDHACRGIALLWDDPERLPVPAVPVVAPASGTSSPHRKEPE